MEAFLRKRNRLLNFIDRDKKIRGLKAERERMEKRVEEFRAAMFCILGHLDGSRWEGFGEEVLGFEEAGLDWERIHHMMIRECRRLEEGLPIYGHRREILQQIRFNQVLFFVFFGPATAGSFDVPLFFYIAITIAVSEVVNFYLLTL